MNYHLAAKYKTDERVSNFKLQKKRRILLSCLRGRRRKIEKIVDIILVFLTLP